MCCDQDLEDILHRLGVDFNEMSCTFLNLEHWQPSMCPRWRLSLRSGWSLDFSTWKGGATTVWILPLHRSVVLRSCMIIWLFIQTCFLFFYGLEKSMEFSSSHKLNEGWCVCFFFPFLSPHLFLELSREKYAVCNVGT